MPDNYIFCKTCGRFDRAWVHGYANRRKTKQKRWKKLIKKNVIFFGYNIIPCLENKHHLIQISLTKLQLARRLRRGNKDGRHTRSLGNQLVRI